MVQTKKSQSLVLRANEVLQYVSIFVFLNPGFMPENQVLAVDESQIYHPPDKLQLPDAMLSLSETTHLQHDTDDDDDDDADAVDSSDSSPPSSPTFAPEPESVSVSNPNIHQMVRQQKH